MCIKKTFCFILASANAFQPPPSQVKNKVDDLKSCTNENGQPDVRVLCTAQHLKLRPEASKNILFYSEDSGRASTSLENKNPLAGLSL